MLKRFFTRLNTFSADSRHSRFIKYDWYDGTDELFLLLLWAYPEDKLNFPNRLTLISKVNYYFMLLAIFVCTQIHSSYSSHSY